MLGFIISLINSDGEGVHSDLNVFGLELMNVALNSGGPGGYPLQLWILVPCDPAVRRDWYRQYAVVENIPSAPIQRSVCRSWHEGHVQPQSIRSCVEISWGETGHLFSRLDLAHSYTSTEIYKVPSVMNVQLQEGKRSTGTERLYCNAYGLDVTSCWVVPCSINR